MQLAALKGTCNIRITLPLYSPNSFLSPPSSRFFRPSCSRRRRATSAGGSGRKPSVRAMPSPSPPSPGFPVTSTPEDSKRGEDALLRSFHLTESTFLASLMPKKETGVDRFLEAHPEYDGRGTVIAIFDSGVDPAADGLQVTSDGQPKILDVLDCTGSGDIDTSTVVKTDPDGCILGKSGTRLPVNPAWENPSGEWHVGCKLVYGLFTDSLTSRLKKERRKKWDEKNQEAISESLKHLNEFDKKHRKIDDVSLKKVREDLQNKLDFLRKQAESYEDRGPVIDVVAWHDGSIWRAAVDTQSLEDDSDHGKLSDFVPLTNYRTEQKYGIFSKLDACSFVLNIYDEGNIVSIVTDSSPHGTHVAGIATAFHPKEPLLNGVAPGAQLISCKIGDSRLGSMETGTGLVRALIAAVEVVDKHRIVFISSAGNNGPALSTVGAPGGTTSSIIGVGAYVSPAMAAAAHCVVEPPSEGLEYTWSSRGPTTDGDLGVSVSAPGGAVAPVPTWTLQRRMLMNGTSMASPSACGGVALLISGMKAEGVPVSPYSVREALENTTVAIGDKLEDKLSTGQGLMQWTVQVQPKFHEDASNMEQLVPFEECIQLHSSEGSIVQVPEFLLLTHNGRSFNIVVDPSKLNKGLHYHEVYGTDCKAPWRGPLFRIPVTITKPISLEGQPPLISLLQKSFLPGHIERIFIDVPLGATWVEATMRTSGLDTARRFFIDAVQVWNAERDTSSERGERNFFFDDVMRTHICPLERPIKWESVVTFSSPSSQSFTFPVKGGLTMELSVAQFWSSGIGSNEATVIDFEIIFHGININREVVVFDGSEAPFRIVAESLLSSQKLIPASTLNKIKIPCRPVESNLVTLSTNRDKLPSGEQILALTLTYKFKLEEGAEIKPLVPLLNNRIYDTKIESQFYMISDSNKLVFGLPGPLLVPDQWVGLYIDDDDN
ncbi:hypothetical protein Taro_039603 [Colocasia esculenta]|uniref:tripeptidyl-peptidase II n=1 Tax=Colocasia esculenta TaxID=4460 RepID=A0A843WS00_COLES|nr:hypothetical protein [Colocasia esculenta]